MEHAMTAESPALAAASTFAFGGFVLEPARQALFLDGAPIRLGSRALEILNVLVRRAGEVVTKREMLARVWPDTIVEEGNLKVQVAVLRKILAQGGALAPYIATVTGRGYRFVAPVRVLPSRGSVAAGLSLEHEGGVGTVRRRLISLEAMLLVDDEDAMAEAMAIRPGSLLMSTQGVRLLVIAPTHNGSTVAPVRSSGPPNPAPHPSSSPGLAG